MRGWGHFACPGVTVDPQPHDVVTPSQAAELFGVPASTVRSWIRRRKVQPLGAIGRYNRYDYRELAEIERDMRAA
jgi:DNA-binding transcriptional MerR regulator